MTVTVMVNSSNTNAHNDNTPNNNAANNNNNTNHTHPSSFVINFLFCFVIVLCRVVVSGVAGLTSSEWRKFCNERRVIDSRGFIDGDLIETFLDLSRDTQLEVMHIMNKNNNQKTSTTTTTTTTAAAAANDGGGNNNGDNNNDDNSDNDNDGGGDGGGYTLDEILQRVEEYSRLH